MLTGGEGVDGLFSVGGSASCTGQAGTICGIACSSFHVRHFMSVIPCPSF